jgi:methionyl aminopeptidase
LVTASVESLWEDPQVPNYGLPGKGPVLRKNMVIAIEPMIAMGGPEVDMIGDWDVLTRDRKPAAHFEHTIRDYRRPRGYFDRFL